MRKIAPFAKKQCKEVKLLAIFRIDDVERMSTETVKQHITNSRSKNESNNVAKEEDNLKDYYLHKV